LIEIKKKSPNILKARLYIKKTSSIFLGTVPVLITAEIATHRKTRVSAEVPAVWYLVF
jgi:hypothetical protein